MRRMYGHLLLFSTTSFEIVPRMVRMVLDSWVGIDGVDSK